VPNPAVDVDDAAAAAAADAVSDAVSAAVSVDAPFYWLFLMLLQLDVFVTSRCHGYCAVGFLLGR